MRSDLLFYGLVCMAEEMILRRKIFSEDSRDTNNIFIFSNSQDKNIICIYYPDEERWYLGNFFTVISQIFASEEKKKNFLKLAEINGIDIEQYTNPCIKCSKRYEKCSSELVIGNCYGKEEI